ncbi:MAG: cytochrome c biogenesis protein ResB [Desulfurivibrionaceae bacterium]
MKNNSVINFFASVRLALFLLFCLALTSIAGTIIPQGKQPEVYVQEYGEKTANLFQVLDLTNMYSSWWFITLLALLTLNLIVCSWKRFPGVWHIIGKDNLDTDLTKLEKKKEHKKFQTALSPQESRGKIVKALKESGWKPREKQRDKNLLLFAEKGAWTRFGVYVVHASILIIFIGALIGKFYGHKGSMMIPETNKKGSIHTFQDRQEIQLGFEILCKKFTLSRYPDGSPKSFVSELAVIEDGKEVLNREIEVNDPLHYKGYTFYQSNYKPLEKLLATMKVNDDNMEAELLIDPGKEAVWEEGGVRFGVVNRAKTSEPGRFRYKVWFYDGSGSPQEFWLTDGDSTTVETADNSYAFSLKEFYATGLQVTKDPGVWWAYTGFILMMVGLYIAFFLSHRRIWVLIKEDEKTEITVSGTSNKNKPKFAQTFEAASKAIENEF